MSRHFSRLLSLHALKGQVRTILITLVVLITVLFGLFLWRSARAGAQAWGQQSWSAQATQISATVLEPREASASIEVIGNLRAIRQVALASEVAGRVSAIQFQAGDKVKTGDMLVQLIDGTERADRRAAEARAAFAAAQLLRSERLEPAGAASKELLEQRRAEQDQAMAALNQIDARLAQKQVRAPFSGEIGIRRIDLGQYLNPGDVIATLSDLTSLYVEFTVPQQELARLKVEALVAVTSDAWPGRKFTAKVKAIEPQIDKDTRNVSVQAVLSNPDRALRPGMYVSAALRLPSESAVLMAPVTAIQSTAQGDTVIVVRGNDAHQGGKAEILPVEVGRRIGSEVVIVSGLKPGDVIVNEGQLRVQPGADVKISRLAPKGAR